MKNDNLTSILTDLAENAAPSEQIDLWPAVKNSLEASGWQLEQVEPTMRHSTPQIRLLRLASLVALVLVAAGIFLFVTPQGRAFANRVILFFSVTDEKSFVLPTDQVFAAPDTPTPAPTHVLPLLPVENEVKPEPTKPHDPSCNTPASQSNYFCQIKSVESLASFDVKEFPYDPKGTRFSSITFNSSLQEVTMEFVVNTGGGYLYFRQGTGDFLPAEGEWSKVPSEAVEAVTVNGNYGEIVSGTYIAYSNATSAVWEPGGQLSLVWRDGERWFALDKLGDPYPIEWITKEELVRLAESLVDGRPVDAVPPLDPEYLKDVADAEDLAGFDVLTPSLLPQGYELKRAAWINERVILFYGSKSSQSSPLIISMGRIETYQVGPCLECPPGTTEEVQVGKWKGWYWRGIFYTGLGAAVQPTPTPVWQADANNWELVWNTDQLWISISFWSPENGLEITRETLLAIAKSLK